MMGEMPMPPGDFSPVLAQCSFHVTAADVTAAQRAHMRWRMRRPQAWFYPLLFSMLAVMAIIVLNPGWHPWDLAEPPLILFGIYIVLVALNYVLMPSASRRTMRRQPGLAQEWHVELSEHGVRASTPLQDNRVAWGSYVAWHHDDRIVMIYHSDHLFQFIPARSVTPAMSELFQSKVANLQRR